MLDAPNLSVAMYRLSGFFKLVLDDLSFELLQHGPYVRMALVEHVDLGPQRQLILEIMLMLVQGVASWMAASRMTFPRIDLAFPVSPDEPDYTHFFPGPVFAGQSLTALYFDPANLGAPIRQEKNALAAFLLRAPADWIRISVKERHVTFRVRDYLEANLQISPGISEVAQALHFSTRTLARRLEEEGSRFQHIKDTLRRDIAIDYICRTDDSIADIGLRLGFDNATAFNRAFKQWTGSSPGAYRKGIGKTPPLPSAVQMAE